MRHAVKAVDVRRRDERKGGYRTARKLKYQFHRLYDNAKRPYQFQLRCSYEERVLLEKAWERCSCKSIGKNRCDVIFLALRLLMEL